MSDKGVDLNQINVYISIIHTQLPGNDAIVESEQS